MAEEDKEITVDQAVNYTQHFNQVKQEIDRTDYWKMQRELIQLRKQVDHLAEMVVKHELRLDKASEVVAEMRKVEK